MPVFKFPHARFGVADTGNLRWVESHGDGVRAELPLFEERIFFMPNQPLIPVNSPAVAPNYAPRIEAAPLPAHQPLTLLNLLRGLRRTWKTALAFAVLLGTMAAACIWLFLPPAKPGAFAKIYFPSAPERTHYEHPDPPLKEQTQKERILSRKMLAKVVARPEIAELVTITEKNDPVAYLAHELTIEFPPGAEIMRITLQGDHPAELPAIVNAVKDVYLAEIKSESENRRDEREARLRQMHAKAENEYKVALKIAIKKGDGVGSGDPQTVAFMQRRLQEQRDQAEIDLQFTRKELEKMNRELQTSSRKLTEPLDVNDALYDSIFQTDEEIVFFTKQRKEIDLKLTERKRLVAPDHPSIKEIEVEARNLLTKLEDRKKDLQPSLESRVRQKLNTDVSRLKIDIRDGEINEQKLAARIEKLTGEAKDLGSATLDAQGTHKTLQKLKEESDSLETALNKLMSERDAPIRAGTLEDAIVVIPNESSRKTRFAGMAFAGMAGFVFICFAFAEYRTRRIGSPDEVALGLGVPVMGTVPARPKRVSRSTSVGPAGAEQVLWEHLINESVDSARTLFLHTADANALHVVMITSAVGGEGKTSLSCQLARSLARSGRRVLLIDGDLRSPAAHMQLGMPNNTGLCELLRREIVFQTAIQPSPIAHLDFMPAGRCDSLSIQELARDGFPRLLDDVRPLYDFVLIDSCPILPVADALLMARSVDGVLLSLMCDYSQIERIQTACQKLNSIGARVFGAVVHGTKVESYGHSSRYLMPVSQA